MLVDAFIDFVKFVNDEEIFASLDDVKKDYFKAYLTKGGIFEKFLVKNDSLALEFASKIGFKMRDVTTLDCSLAQKIYEKNLFEINKTNVKYYSRLFGSENNKFGFFEENRKFFKDMEAYGVDDFVSVMIQLTEEFFEEKESFLFRILYLARLTNDSLVKFIKKIPDNSLDYSVLFKDGEKRWASRLQIDADFGDDVCEQLVVNNKLTLSFGNLFVAVHQLQANDDGLLPAFINEFARNKKDEFFPVQMTAFAQEFGLYAFQNDFVKASAWNLFARAAGRRKIFVPDIIFKKYIEDDQPIEIVYKNWSVDKCASVLLCFSGYPYRTGLMYAPLICYLVKRDLKYVLRRYNFIVRGQGFSVSGRNVSADFVEYTEDSVRLTRNKLRLCVYASLLYNEKTEEKKQILDDFEIDQVLELIDLDFLDDIFDEWKNVHEIKCKSLIENVLKRKSAYYDKIFDSSVEGQKYAIHFLKGLIGYVDKTWLKDAFDEDLHKNQDVIMSIKDRRFERSLNELRGYLENDDIPNLF